MDGAIHRINHYAADNTSLGPGFGTLRCRELEHKTGADKSVMAASNGSGLLRMTLWSLTSFHLSINRLRIASFSPNTCRTLFTTQKRFSRAQDGDTDEAKTRGARNLLEVYKMEPSLLDGPRNALKPVTEEYVEQEMKKSLKVRFKRPVKIEPHKVRWTTGSQRVGTIGVKLGMTALWLKDGRRIPVTLLQIKDCQVVQTRISRHHGGKDHKTELQVGAVDENDLYKIKKAQFGHFRKHGMNPKKKVKSFSVTRNALLHPGTHLYAAHYYPGQYVKIQGVTKDRGFQGVMKRWKMKGQPQSHGQTKTHRKMGASGGGTNPGRIFPGKRMAGHMGNKNCTKFAVRILRINTKYNVLYIHGECPGKKGGFIVIGDAWKKHEHPPPFPTYFPDPDNPLPEDLFADDVQRFEETIYFSKDKQSESG